MSRSSGVYSLPAGQPVVAGTTISDTVFNTLTADLANEITNSLPRDGTAPPTANLPMGNFKITGLANGSLATDAAAFGQIASGITGKANAGANADITSLTACTTITATAVTVATDDKVMVKDTSAADVLKTVTTQSIADLLTISPTVVKGYGTGAGGAVTQATDKGTGVTLSTPTGKITMNSASLASNTTAGFVLTNTLITTSDVLVLNHNQGANYNIWATCNAGSAGIYVRNITGAPLSDAVVINFVLLRGAIA